MARGVNKVILLGNLGADPETRYTGSGTAVTEIRIATTESWTDKQSGEKQERTEWHRCTLWGRLAEIAGEYLKKGRQVYVEGSLQTDKFTDKDGVERFATKVRVSDMQMIGGAPDGERRQGGGNSRNDYGDAPRSGSNQRSQQRNAPPKRDERAPEQGNMMPPPNDNFDDDDIPF